MLNNLIFTNKEIYFQLIEENNYIDKLNNNPVTFKSNLYNYYNKKLEIDFNEDFLNNLTKHLYEDIFFQLFNTTEIKKINYLLELKNLDFDKKFYYLNLLFILNQMENYPEIFLLDNPLIKELNKHQKLTNKNYFFETLNLVNFLYKRNLDILTTDNIFEIKLIDIEKINYDYKIDIDSFNNKKEILNFLIQCFNKSNFLLNKESLIKQLTENQNIFGFEENKINDLYNSYNLLISNEEFKNIKKNLIFLNNTNVKRTIELELKNFAAENALFNNENQKNDFEKGLEYLKLNTSFTENGEILNSFLTHDKELEKLNNAHMKEINKFEELLNQINDLANTDLTSGISNIINAIGEYYDLVKTGNKNHLQNLDNIFFSSQFKENLFSKDFCSILYLTIYIVYSSLNEKPLENFENATEYFSKKESLKGIKSLPGYLEINQLKYENWDAKAEFIKDSSFFKSYANFYNFYTKDKNPFNNSLKDKDFEYMQELAIRAKRLLESESTNSTQDKLNDIFYKPLSGSNHSIYTYTNLIADLFKEFNEPIDFELLENFGISLISYLKNLALETGSSLLLEWTLELFSKEFIKIGENKYSIMSIYNELYMLKKILYLIKSEDQSLNDLLRMNLTEISSTVLNDSKLGQILKEEAFLALNGLDFTSSLIYDFNKLFNNTENQDGFYTSLLYTYKDEKGKEYLWNLKAINLPAWVTMKFIINKYKTIDPELISLNFQSKSFFNNQLLNLNSYENSYAFLCSILNKKDYIEYLNNELNLGYNNKQILEILNLLPSSVNDNNFNYFESFNELYKSFSSILSLTHLYDFKAYKLSIRKDFNLFHKVVNYNYNAILDAILSGQNSPLIDTVMRLLPTTRLLFGTFNVPLDQYLDKLLSWFDELLFTLLNYLKKLMYENKIKFIDNYKRERLYLIKNTWDYRIRAFNILLDIIYSNISVASFCFNHDFKNDKDILLDIYQQFIDKFEKENLNDLKNDLENPKDPNIKIPDFPNPINPDLTDKDKDDILDEIDKSIENKIIVVEKNNKDESNRKIIIIFPSEEEFEDKYSENKNTIITKPITKPEEFIEELKKDEITKVEINFDEDWINNIFDFLLPGNEEIKNDIYESYISKDLNHLFYKNTSGNHQNSIEQLLNNRYKELKDSNISYSDSGYISYINFNKINFKILNETLNNFDYTNYKKIKETSLEFFNNF